MEFKEFFIETLTPPERADFAERCETTVGHLNNIAYGDKTCGEDLAVRIDRESGGKVVVESLRPDVDWAYLRGTSKRPSRVTTRRCG